MITLGDMAQQFASVRASGAIKSDLARLSASLSSGRVADVTAHLSGDTGQVSAINHRLQTITGYQQVIRETDQTLDAIQQVLARVDASRGQLAETMLLVNDTSAQDQVDTAARAARVELDTMIGALNTRLNDRALLAGRDVDATPLTSSAAIMAGIVTAIGTDRSAAGITAAVDAWFTDTGAGFVQTGYLGDTSGLMQRKISQDTQIVIQLRADDQTIRETLKSTVLAAVAAELPDLTAATKSDLVQTAAKGLFSAASGLAQAQSRIGATQATMAETRMELNAEQAGLKMAANDLVLADPFETATRLQSVQQQLETHFTVIGRLSQLSLLRFL